MLRPRLAFAAATALLAALVPVAGHATSTGQVVLISQGEELDVYNIDTGEMRTTGPLVENTDWVNGPPCFVPGDAAGRFVEADDNPNENGYNGELHPYFGLFTKSGARSFDASIGDVGRISGGAALDDPAGCAFDASSNLFGVDVGYDHTPFQGNGQLVEFFAPTYKTSCVLATGLSQPGMVSFDIDGSLLVPQAGAATITRFSDFPASASGCHPAAATEFLNGFLNGIGTPIGIVRAPDGGWAVSSVLAPSGIFHVSTDGIVDGVLAAPGPNTGTPFGLAYDSEGNLYYADLGVRPFPLDGTDPSDPIDAAADQAALRFVPAGGPPIPQLISGSMNFADGIVVVPASAIS